jgi:hypothetical protein
VVVRRKEGGYRAKLSLREATTARLSKGIIFFSIGTQIILAFDRAFADGLYAIRAGDKKMK